VVLQRWDPFKELRRLDHAMDRMWRGFPLSAEVEQWSVPLDVIQENDKIVVHASVPGARPEDVQVTIEDGVLTIEGETQAEHEERGDGYLMRERRSGKFHRALRLPDTVNTDKAESRYEDGVLTVTLPKAGGQKSPQKISIQ